MEIYHITDMYEKWIKHIDKNSPIYDELINVKNLQDEIEERFASSLSFGTSGLRAKMGGGTARINEYTIRQATQGIANVLNDIMAIDAEKYIAIAYDSRKNSELYAKKTAEVFAANNIGVYIFDKLMPTPVLSYAVRELGAMAGIVITASHNPQDYNGYKVYDNKGCQITDKLANVYHDAIREVDIFNDVKSVDFKEAISNGKIRYIEHKLVDKFIDDVYEYSMSGRYEDIDLDNDIKIVYTPLHGSGRDVVPKIFSKCGFDNVINVEEQLETNGEFVTCPVPNPEENEAFRLALQYARENDADIVVATDPDSDRMGVCAKDEITGEYLHLTGNEVGILLFDFICQIINEKGVFPDNGVLIKSIVSTCLVNKIADKYNVNVIDVLIGFKYIGEIISNLEERNELDRFLFGFEESLGYLGGSYARDKDATYASMMLAEMTGYYKKRGITLVDRLVEIKREYGYVVDKSISYQFDELNGDKIRKAIMSRVRERGFFIDGFEIIEKVDYSDGINGLPVSDLLKLFLLGEQSIIIRPSGTEPKIKIYISVIGDDAANAQSKMDKLEQSIRVIIENIVEEFNVK
ncbi:MAG: phospho-sugar mutase [Gallibacter sp.]|nr:phospho-sugar mutase [Gallibacter sp.]